MEHQKTPDKIKIRGGTIIAQGNLEAVADDPNSKIGGFLTGKSVIDVGNHIPAAQQLS